MTPIAQAAQLRKPMPKLSRLLCACLAAAALGALLALGANDALLCFAFSPLHRLFGALALIMIGASYVALQTCDRRPLADRMKGMFLGAAFVMWGLEQLLPPGRIVTAMDFMVVAIFVVDLNLIIFAQLRRRAAVSP